jgi:cell division protein FtsB
MTKGRTSSRLEAVRKTPSLGRAIAREGAYGLALVLAGASILYLCVLLPSRLKTERIRDRRDELKVEKAKLESELDGLRAETRALETEPWAVERALRRRLSFIRPGERVLKLARS